MIWIRHNKAPTIAFILLVAAVLTAILVSVLTPSRPPHVVKLIPVVYRAPATGGGSIPVPHYFVRTLRHHTWCGSPTTHAKRGIHGVFRQFFHHCQMAIGPVKVYGLPPPERPVIGGVVGGTPTVQPTRTPVPAPPSIVPAPTDIPVPTSAVPMPIATPRPPEPLPTAGGNNPVTYELSLMNATRAQYGLPPYSLDAVQSDGTSSCGGSIGHSQDMAASGTIWHVNASYPQESFPNNFCGSGYHALGENVGMAGGYSVTGSLDVIHQSMMAEPHSPGCQGNHACSIISAQYTRVGIGVYTANGSTWLTVDFEG